jgi:hypothetical protein
VIVLRVDPPMIIAPFLKDKGKRIEPENGVTTTTIAARYKISGILPIWPISDKEFFGYRRLLPFLQP